MSMLDCLARGSAMSLEELAAEVGDKRRRIEAESVMKARQNAERMERHDFRSRNDAKR